MCAAFKAVGSYQCLFYMFTALDPCSYTGVLVAVLFYCVFDALVPLIYCLLDCVLCFSSLSAYVAYV